MAVKVDGGEAYVANAVVRRYNFPSPTKVRISDFGLTRIPGFRMSDSGFRKIRTFLVRIPNYFVKVPSLCDILQCNKAGISTRSVLMTVMCMQRVRIRHQREPLVYIADQTRQSGMRQTVLAESTAQTWIERCSFPLHVELALLIIASLLAFSIINCGSAANDKDKKSKGKKGAKKGKKGKKDDDDDEKEDGEDEEGGDDDADKEKDQCESSVGTTTKNVSTRDGPAKKKSGNAKKSKKKPKKKGAKSAGGAGAPAQGGPTVPEDPMKVVQTNDPNYQTLAMFNNKDMFNKQPGAQGQPMGGAGPIAPGPVAPSNGGVAATNDPNYQTLCNLNNDCFTPKGNQPAAPWGGGPGFAPAPQVPGGFPPQGAGAGFPGAFR
uniref:Protein kinase domain-containing protein n=1 Tax=Steinernema glaseri TaxID=37863 RepID=A0A1I8AGM0_9BILA